ncbi:MAG: hypothetical protein JWO62_1116, partial [Acidimicrobiaceae bacterium]|nr:hypothetical protein [Acidimicrobiaceae bacterium]
EPEYGGIDPVVYAEVVNVVYPAMKAADPTCRVGVGVVANVNMGGKGQSWLAKAFAAGLVGDFLSYHSYDGWSGVASPDVPPSQWWGGNGVLAVCQQFETWAISQGWHGDFWITETGIQSTDPSGGMTLALQAQWMGELLPLYEQLSPAPKVVCIYELSDEGQGTDIDWGMMTGEGIGPKPVYAVVQALAAPAPTPPAPVPLPPPAPAPVPETANQYAAAHGMVIIDVAEARQAIHVGISYYTWSNGAMHGSRLPSIPTGITLYAFAAPLDIHHIHHAGP